MDDIKLENIKTADDLIEIIKLKTSNSSDMYYRQLNVLGENLYIVYNECSASTELVSNFVIRSLEDISKSEITNKKLENIENNLEEEKINKEKRKII